MAECHPVGFQWVMEAKARGATIVHVDPRYTRTSALADVYVPLRPGTDIAFLGGLINHVLNEGKEFREYVVAYTNAATIVADDFRDTEDLDGIFSGFDPERRSYDPSSWQYEGTAAMPAAGHREWWGGAGSETESSARRRPARDETLTHPRCVFQLLRRHYSRYTPELVERICGVPRQQFLQVAQLLTDNSGRERTSAFAYAMGWTQHTVGVQSIRAASVLQLLLGNVGRPGGGVLALRGHASIQGSTDIPTLYDLLPGYLPMRRAHDHQGLDEFVAGASSRTGQWGHMRAYLVSLLKAWWGEAATPENEFCFDYLPRVTGNHGTYQTVQGQLDGRVKGYFLAGENPAVGSANGKMQRLGMSNLDWLVVRDLAMIESATWWLDGPEIETGELRTEDIGTEVFFLPAAAHTEKDGSFTNTQRLLQWHHQAVDPPDDARSDLWFYYHLGRIIREKLAGSVDEADRPVLDLVWDYPTVGDLHEPSAEAVLREINGWDASGRPLSSFTQLADDGSTVCGCWIYCGCYAEGVNQTARRKPGAEQSWVAPEWGWAWPANRRLLYNRASADPAGRPWSQRKAYLWWDEDRRAWTGHDVPDCTTTKPPGYQPTEGASGVDALSGTDPFIMQADGKGWLFAPAGLTDGPFPTHYEPQESPVDNLLHTQQRNPVRQVFSRRHNRYHPSGGASGAEVFPYVVSTYRLTEHHTAGGMSRGLPYLSELQPEMFCEVSPELAAERGLEHLGWATIISARTAIEARVVVTSRMASLDVAGRRLHQVGLPYHWGHNGLTTGDSANDILSFVLDPNILIQESKAATCDIRPGRRPRGAALLELVESYQRRAGIGPETGVSNERG